MIEAEWHTYDTVAEMAEAVAQHVSSIVANALHARGDTLLAMPGGKSPSPIFRRLANANVDWEHVTIIPTDDRVVPLEDPLSNYAAIANHFVPKGANVVPMVAEPEADYRTAGSVANAKIADLRWPPDLVWLGMGPDGHIASILDGPDLESALAGPSARRALGLMPCPLPADAPVARVTLSGPAILSARALLLTITGPEKRAVAQRALIDGPLSAAPIGRVLAHAKGSIDIFWSRR